MLKVFSESLLVRSSTAPLSFPPFLRTLAPDSVLREGPAHLSLNSTDPVLFPDIRLGTRLDKEGSLDAKMKSVEALLAYVSSLPPIPLASPLQMLTCVFPQ